MNKYIIIAVAMYVICSPISAKDNVELNVWSDNETIVSNINCYGVDVQFARGVRWAPVDLSVELTVGGIDSPLRLEKGCYANMSCAYYKARPSVVVVAAPACGGNAVNEEYIVIDLKSGKKTLLNYQEAEKANIN